MNERHALAREGFSLVEALIALALSGVILALVSTVFLAQNRFHADVNRRSAVQESVRSIGELVGSDVRGLALGAVVVAQPDRLVVRAPLAVGVACGAAGGGGQQHAYFPLDGVAPDPAGVQGWARRATDGSWTFVDVPGEVLLGASGDLSTMNSCQGYGADVGQPAENFTVLATGTVPTGSLLMLYSLVELTFDPSGLQPGRMAIYRGTPGSTLTEFATGVSEETRFAYRVNGAFDTTVTDSADLKQIDLIRLVVDAVPDSPGGSGSGFGWTIDIPLRNVK